MKLSVVRLSGLALLCLWAGPSYFLPAQEKAQTGKAIDLDRELRGKEVPDRGLSYYHFALAKWYEDKSDLGRALDEMRKAQARNESSVWVRVEIAGLLEKMGRIQEAINEAQEASRLDPKDPEPHWRLANLYLRGEGRGRPSKDSLRKAAAELESMQQDAPDDQRAYYALGGIYVELEEPEKAARAFEKFQSLVPDTDAGYMALARYYDRAGNRQKAIDYLKLAVESQPDSPESLMMLGSLYSRAAQDKEAIPVFRKLIEITGGNPAVKRQLASSLIDNGEYDEALKLADELVEALPNEADVKILKARALLGTGKSSEAVEVLKPLVEEHPDHMEASFYLASAYERSGQTAAAVPILVRLLENTTTSEEYKANRRVFQEHLAAAYFDLGESDKAVRLYEEMVRESNERDPRLQFLLINAYRNARQLDKALALGKQQFEIDPSDTNIALVYARTLADAGRSKEGAEILTRLLQADPSNLDIYVNLSQVYLQGKKYSDAEKILRRAEERKLDAERIKFQLGAVYERQKEFDRAEALFREILKENPKNATALNYIGYMLADRGVRLDEAVKYIQEALEIDPDNGAYLDSLGWAFFRLNDFDKAEKYLLRAVAIQKTDATIHDHLGDLYFKTGDFEKARDYWTRSLEHGTEPEETEKTRDKLEKLQEMLRKPGKQRQ